MTLPAVIVRCAGCGTTASPDEPYPFRCPRAGTDDTDHVMTAVIDPQRVRFPRGTEPDPFVRYRELSYAHAVAVAHGLSDRDYVDLVTRLNRAVARVEGHGFAVTPFGRSDALSDVLGSAASGGVWVKDETGNVSGSHKGRHLMGLLIYLEVVEEVGLATGPRRDLAIASCGNAALAAAVVARAGDRRLRVFIPTWAAPAIVERLSALGADLVVCPREPGVPGDPTYHRLREAVRAGDALPFTCQGPDNGLTIDGGKTLGYEIVSDLIAAHGSLDRVVIQVGGGALASACIQAFQDAVRLGALARLPQIHAVQTEGAHPLVRAYERVAQRVGAAPAAIDEALAYAASHRSEFMWPWEEEPQSVASGILDDETYDWLAVVRGMAHSGGYPVLASEALLQEANAVAVRATGVNVDETGSAALAGLLALHRREELRRSERVAVLFTGIRR